MFLKLQKKKACRISALITLIISWFCCAYGPFFGTIQYIFNRRWRLLVSLHLEQMLCYQFPQEQDAHSAITSKRNVFYWPQVQFLPDKRPNLRVSIHRFQFQSLRNLIKDCRLTLLVSAYHNNILKCSLTPAMFWTLNMNCYHHIGDTGSHNLLGLYRNKNWFKNCQ